MTHEEKLIPKKYRGNLDSSLVMKNEFETRYYWVRLKKIHYSPKNPSEQNVVYQTQCFSKQDWIDMMRAKAGNPAGGTKFQIDWVKVANFDSYELLHDPTLVTDLKELAI